MYVIETIRRSEELERLAPEWDRLCRADPNATPFQTPAWGLSWWRHLGSGSLRCRALRADGELVGLAPLYVSRRMFPSFRRIAFLGTGCSDYLDCLLHPEHQGSTAKCLLEAAADCRKEWDYLDLQQLGRRANALRVRNENLSIHPHSSCPFLPLAGLDGMGNVPSGLSKNLRYNERRLQRSGGVVYRLSNAATLDADLDALFRLHRLRWGSRGLPGVFGSARVQAFHGEVAARFLDQGLLRLHLLQRDARILAMALCYTMNSRTFYYGGGFDPTVAVYSPGSLIIAAAIRHAAAEGCVEFDFLRGEESYKRLWGCETRRNHRLIGTAGTRFSRLARHLPSIEDKAQRAGRRALDAYLRLRR